MYDAGQLGPAARKVRPVNAVNHGLLGIRDVRAAPVHAVALCAEKLARLDLDEPDFSALDRARLGLPPDSYKDCCWLLRSESVKGGCGPPTNILT
jgi:hypothetical protein